MKTTEEERIVRYTGRVLHDPTTMKEVHEYEYRFKADETRLEEGKLVSTNNSLETKSVKERALVIFVGRMAQKNGARNWDAGIMEGEEGDSIKVKRVTIESRDRESGYGRRRDGKKDGCETHLGVATRLLYKGSATAEGCNEEVE